MLARSLAALTLPLLASAIGISQLYEGPHDAVIDSAGFDVMFHGECEYNITVPLYDGCLPTALDVLVLEFPSKIEFSHNNIYFENINIKRKPNRRGKCRGSVLVTVEAACHEKSIRNGNASHRERGRSRPRGHQADDISVYRQ